MISGNLTNYYCLETGLKNTYSIVTSNEMNLIYNEETNVLHVLPLFPAAWQDVPLVWGADDDVTFTQQLEVSARLTSEQDNLLIQSVLELLVPVNKDLHKK